METISINSLSGRNIQLMIRHPEQQVKGVVLINPGTCIPQKVYWNFADFLTKNNYISITYDYGDAQNFKSKVSHVDWIKDMNAAMQYVVENFADCKKYCVGHSSGGQLIGYSSSAKDFDQLFLVASTNGYWKYLNPLYKLLMLLFWYIIVPLNVLINGYFNNKMYGVSGGFPKKIILELRHFCLSKQFFLPYFAQQKVPLFYNTIQCPVKSYYFADDAVTSLKGCQFILDLYANAPREIETLKAKDYGMKYFGHRGFFNKKAEYLLWNKFLIDLI